MGVIANSSGRECGAAAGGLGAGHAQAVSGQALQGPDWSSPVCRRQGGEPGSCGENIPSRKTAMWPSGEMESLQALSRGVMSADLSSKRLPLGPLRGERTRGSEDTGGGRW